TPPNPRRSRKILGCRPNRAALGGVGRGGASSARPTSFCSRTGEGPPPPTKRGPDMSTAMSPARLTVAETAERLRASPATVLRLIGAKELRAINAGAGMKRPRWIVSEADLADFQNPP